MACALKANVIAMRCGKVLIVVKNHAQMIVVIKVYELKRLENANVTMVTSVKVVKITFAK